MAEFLLQIVTHPFESIGILLSICAAVGFAVFAAGFFGGLKQLIRIDAPADHVEHARTRVVWGVVLMAFFFLLWETVRVIRGFFAGSVGETAAYLVAGIWAVVIVIFLLKKLFGSGGGGH